MSVRGGVVLAAAWLAVGCTSDAGGKSAAQEPNAVLEEDASVDEDQDEVQVDAAVTTCGGATKEEACTAFCEAFCQAQELFCQESQCLPEDCQPGGEIVERCVTRCDDAACGRDLCEDLAEVACDTFGFEAGGRFETYCLDRDPSCIVGPEPGCSDVCGTREQVGGDLADNGICEDGSSDAVAGVCARGTDCSDCGPKMCSPAGGSCVVHGDCCGFGDPGALCVDTDGENNPEPPICLPVCDEDNPCPSGFVCNPTTGRNSVCLAASG